MYQILLDFFDSGADFISLFLGVTGALVIIAASVLALVRLLHGLIGQKPGSRPFAYTHLDTLRVEFGRYINLGLEFFIAKDVIETMFLPTWTHLGQLFALVVIRTLISYFLIHEVGEISRREK